MMFSAFVAAVLLALLFCISSVKTALSSPLSSHNPNLRQSETVSDAVLFIVGAFGEFGLHSGVLIRMKKDDQVLWHYDLMTEFSPFFQVRIQRANKSNESGMSQLGALHNRTVPGQLLPLSLLETIINIDRYPSPKLAYRITVNDTDQRYYLSPVGSWQNQVAIFFFLGVVPILTGFASIRVYLYAFYAVKVNKFGNARKESVLTTIQSKMRFNHCFSEISLEVPRKENIKSLTPLGKSSTKQSKSFSSPRRTILIATMEYEIDDWDIRIDNGGLGVMTQLMSKNLEHEDLVWVIPCVRDIAYPEDQRANPMAVTIFGSPYIVQVQYHRLRNITFVLLDAPVFRAQTKAEPYPRRMDDIDSAIYYSSWYVFSIMNFVTAISCILSALNFN